MRMIDDSRQCSLKSISLYLTPREATEIRRELDRLLKDPEANEHFHVYSDQNDREVSCSIITDAKLKNIKSFNKTEQKILTEQ